MKIAQSPLSALRASSGDWLIFTLGLREISSLLIPRPEDLYILSGKFLDLPFDYLFQGFR